LQQHVRKAPRVQIRLWVTPGFSWSVATTLVGTRGRPVGPACGVTSPRSPGSNQPVVGSTRAFLGWSNPGSGPSAGREPSGSVEDQPTSRVSVEKQLTQPRVSRSRLQRGAGQAPGRGDAARGQRVDLERQPRRRTGASAVRSAGWSDLMSSSGGRVVWEKGETVVSREKAHLFWVLVT
jgi:hypothetical protein